MTYSFDIALREAARRGLMANASTDDQLAARKMENLTIAEKIAEQNADIETNALAQKNRVMKDQSNNNLRNSKDAALYAANLKYGGPENRQAYMGEELDQKRLMSQLLRDEQMNRVSQRQTRARLLSQLLNNLDHMDSLGQDGTQTLSALTSLTSPAANGQGSIPAGNNPVINEMMAKAGPLPSEAQKAEAAKYREIAKNNTAGWGSGLKFDKNGNLIRGPQYLGDTEPNQSMINSVNGWNPSQLHKTPPKTNSINLTPKQRSLLTRLLDSFGGNE